MNEKSYRFLVENKQILDQLNYYEWLKMCQEILRKENREIPALSTRMENITKRNDLTFYKNELIQLSNDDSTCFHCFYCGAAFKRTSHLDHVIPWSFLKEDNLWDFVFACPRCNESKSDRLPTMRFINKLDERNKKLRIASPDLRWLIRVAMENGVEYDWQPKIIC